MKKAVIFDLDDTLISEKQYIESGFSHIAKLLSKKLKIDEKVLFKLLLELFHESRKNVFNRLLDNFGIRYKKDMIMDLVEEYRNHFPVINFYEDVLPCLEVLKKRGIKVGIITDGYANAQRQKLNAVKLYDYFDEIILTDELGREYWKPHPKAFEMMREKMNVEFHEMVYVGDNPEKDFYIKEMFPIRTVRILRENGVHKESNYLNKVKENYSIHSLTEINEIIDK